MYIYISMYIYSLPMFLCGLHPNLLSIFCSGVMALVGDAIATKKEKKIIYIHVYTYRIQAAPYTLCFFVSFFQV